VAARGFLNLAQATEAALIIAAQARDQAAFGELVKRRQGWARALLRRMCSNHAEADDLAQEAFIKAWDRLMDLETPAAFPGWFRRIAVTTFLMAKRKQKAIFEEIDDASGRRQDRPGEGACEAVGC
jgi:RNA polymerase sigma-70 factor (ECF subfamily)